MGKKGHTSHHLKTQSFGGRDTPENEILIDDQAFHKPYHTIFGGFPLDIAIWDLIGCWNTINPHKQKTEPNVTVKRLEGRIGAWNTLFGPRATQRKAIQILIEEFVVYSDDFEKAKVADVLDRGLRLGEISKSDKDLFDNMLKKKGTKWKRKHRNR